MIELSIDDKVFEVVKEEMVGDGCFRIVRYGSGYYGLQSLTNDDEWDLILLSPVKDSGDYSGDYEFLMGSMGYINLVAMLGFINDAYRLYKGDFWELKLYFNGDLKDKFCEVISRRDGESIVEMISEVNSWVSEVAVEQMNNDLKWKYLIFGITGFFIILMLLFVVRFVL